MTNLLPAPDAPAPTPEFPLPGSAVAMLGLSPVLILVGALTFLGTASRDYVTGAPLQVLVGTVLFSLGVACLLSGTLVAAVRGFVRQQTVILLEAARR